MKFMLLCAQQQTVQPTETNTLVYDNRIEEIPSHAKAGLKTYASRDEMMTWWQEFLGAKFAFLAQLLEQPDIEQTTAQKASGHDEPQWIDIYSQWREQSDVERLVYQLRLSQGPSVEAVAVAWYSSLPEFERWAQLCQENFESALAEPGPSRESYAKHRVASRVHGPSFHAEQWASRLEARAITHVAEKLRTGLEAPITPDDQTLKWISDEASNITHAELSDAGELVRLPVYRAIVRIAKEFVAIAQEASLDSDAHIRSLLAIVKAEFGCRECDFLSTTEDRLGLSFTASTAVTVDEEQARRLEEEEYAFGHGITGSLLLATPDDDAFCVGTNNLDGDERQSPGHRRAFEGPYGEVQNFWVFPVWHRRQLLGGFRVVTRLQADGETAASEGWPLYVRLQLSALAGFVSELWEFIGEQTVDRSSGRAARLEATRVALSEQLGMGDVTAGFLEAIVEHVETVALMRVEKRAMGVCIGIVPSRGLLSDLQPYAAIDDNELQRQIPEWARRGSEETLRWCSRLYNKVAPMYGLFAFDHDGRLLGVYDLRYRNGKVRLPAIEALSENEQVTVVLLERGSASAGIYHGGSKVAEYFLHERVGEWRLRVFEDVRKAVAVVTQLPERTVRAVLKEVLDLSYGRAGALVALGPNLVSRLNANGFRVEQSLTSMGSGDFENWAKEDGAVLVSTDGMVEMGGFILSLDVDIEQDVARRLEREQKGGRHKAAALLSTFCRDVLVFVVSENRGVSIFCDGQIVLWDV